MVKVEFECPSQLLDNSRPGSRLEKIDIVIMAIEYITELRERSQVACARCNFQLEHKPRAILPPPEQMVDELSDESDSSDNGHISIPRMPKRKRDSPSITIVEPSTVINNDSTGQSSPRSFKKRIKERYQNTLVDSDPEPKPSTVDHFNGDAIYTKSAAFVLHPHKNFYMPTKVDLNFAYELAAKFDRIAERNIYHSVNIMVAFGN